jgi:phosphate starvation-inducible membrane PsiE
MPDQQGTEPTIHPEPPRAERRWDRALERGAGILTSIVGLMLILFVVVALAGAVQATIEPLVHGQQFTHAAVEGVDAAFLAIILLELVHTTLSKGPISRQLQEFLVIGATSGVRSGLEVAAGARGADPRQTVIALAIDSLGVLLLVIALWLVRQHFGDESGAAS